MTKDVNPSSKTLTGVSANGRYESSNPDGDVVLTIAGSNLGAPPSIAVYATLSNGSINTLVGVNDPEIGDFNVLNGNYANPKYFTLDGSSGMAGTEGGITAATNNRAGWRIDLPNFTEYFCSFQMGVPDYILGQPEQRTFSGSTVPRTLPALSTLKPVWLSDGPLDDPALADLVLFSWISSSFSILGNNSATPIDMGSDFDFNVFNSYSCYQQAGADPFVDNGITRAASSTPLTGTLEVERTNTPTFANATNAHYNTVNIQGWRGEGDQDLTMHLYRNFYIATGANAQARIELGDSATYAACGARVTVPHASWSASQVVSLPVNTKQRTGMTHYYLTTADGTRYSGLIEDVI